MADKTTGKLKLWLAKITDKISDTINIYLSENFSKIDDEFSSLKDDIDEHKADDASTTAKGHVQLNDTVTSTSTTQAATANAVKTVNDALISHKNDKATEEDLGHVKVDGETIQIDENGIISGSITQNKNLLHNWDFRNPVNQRGFTSTTNAEYTIDRWRTMTSGHTVELTPNGLKLTASSGAGLNYCIAQYIENYKEFEGKTLTLSVHVVENTLTRGYALRWNDTSGSRITGTGLFSFTFTPSSLSSLSVGIQFWNSVEDNGNYLIIDKIKLELGSVSTLANDPPADYREQLMLCKEFLRNIILSPDEADAELMGNGDIWIKYEIEE